MDDFERHLAESLKDPEFAKEWEAQAPEREIMRAIVEERIAQNLSQKELAERCDMKPSNLCRIENGNGNPSLATLKKIAHGLGRRLELKFVKA